MAGPRWKSESKRHALQKLRAVRAARPTLAQRWTRSVWSACRLLPLSHGGECLAGSFRVTGL